MIFVKLLVASSITLTELISWKGAGASIMELVKYTQSYTSEGREGFPVNIYLNQKMVRLQDRTKFIVKEKGMSLIRARSIVVPVPVGLKRCETSTWNKFLAWEYLGLCPNISFSWTFFFIKIHAFLIY